MHLGELSSARQAARGRVCAKNGSDIRVGDEESSSSSICQKSHSFSMFRFNKNVRSTKPGAAAGPSGMTVKHLHPLSNNPKQSRFFEDVVGRFARGSA